MQTVLLYVFISYPQAHFVKNIKKVEPSPYRGLRERTHLVAGGLVWTVESERISICTRCPRCSTQTQYFFFSVNFVWSQKKCWKPKKSQRRLPLRNHQETKLGAAPLIINGEQRFLGRYHTWVSCSRPLFHSLPLAITHMHAACKSQREVRLFCRRPFLAETPLMLGCTELRFQFQWFPEAICWLNCI